MKKVTAVLCCLMSGAAMATDFSLSFSEHSATFEFDQNLGPNFKMGFTGMYHEENGSIMDFGFMATHTAGQLNGAIGVKAFALDPRGDSTIGWSLAPGGSVGVAISQNMRVEAEYFYAPSILSFNKTKNVNQFDSRFVFAPMPNAELYVGYRNVYAKLNKSGKHTFHEGGYLGLSFKF